MPHWESSLAGRSGRALGRLRGVRDAVGGGRVRGSLGDGVGALGPGLLRRRFPVTATESALRPWRGTKGW